MIGVLVVTHGNFSEAIIQSMELVFGHQEKLDYLTLNHGDDIQELFHQIQKKKEELDEGDGVIMLVDLLGGSPCNMVAKCLQNTNIQCVTGVNLPMLITVLEERENKTLDELPMVAMDAAVGGIVDLRNLMS